MFWTLTALLFLLAASFILIPVWLRSRASIFENEEVREATNIALFHERSNELESDLATGNIDQEQFESLMLELQQSLLADVAQDEEANDESEAVGNSHIGVAVPLVLAILLPLFAYGLYSQWGYIRDVQMMDLFQRTVENTGDPEEAQKLVVSIGQAVQENEDMPWAWYFLAENFANISMFSEAEISYQRAAALMKESPEKALVLGRVALSKYINAGFEFTPEILEVIEEARAINPSEVSILQLLAADAEQNQDYSAAIEYWRLLIQVNPNSEQAQTLRGNIAAAQQLLAQEDPDFDSGPSLDIAVSLAEGIELDESLRVFVAARNAARDGLPPLAVADLTVANLPTTVRLDNNSAVGPFNLGSAESVFVSALVSYAGVASPSAGDYRVVSESFQLDEQSGVIELVISERVQ